MDNHTTRLCPTCGKEFQITAKHPNIRFCSELCFHESQRETRVCLCGKEYRVRRSSTAKYCSAACGYKYRKRPPDPSKHETRKCKGCGSDFETWVYRETVFCSHRCMSRYAARLPKPRPNPPEYVTIYCEACNKEYVLLRSYYELRGSRYCSKQCRNIGFSENRRGANNPMYSGGTKHPDRGRNWSGQRKLAKRRDSGKCQICGTDKKKRRISVHHITPYKDFNGDYLKANELTNLITLCQKCHNQVERHGLPCPKRLF